jgi:hypothetical protein
MKPDGLNFVDSVGSLNDQSDIRTLLQQAAITRPSGAFR